MRSITHGEVTFDQMVNYIQDFIHKDPHAEYEVTVGTDTQNFELTKTVLVVAVHRLGLGGIFFYDVRHVKRINDIRQKIFWETDLSLQMAQRLSERFQAEHIMQKITVHADVGQNGPTKALIPEVVGWVRGSGFDCRIKPESYTASAVANRISK